MVTDFVRLGWVREVLRGCHIGVHYWRYSDLWIGTRNDNYGILIACSVPSGDAFRRTYPDDMATTATARRRFN